MSYNQKAPTKRLKTKGSRDNSADFSDSTFEIVRNCGSSSRSPFRRRLININSSYAQSPANVSFINSANISKISHNNKNINIIIDDNSDFTLAKKVIPKNSKTSPIKSMPKPYQKKKINATPNDSRSKINASVIKKEKETPNISTASPGREVKKRSPEEVKETVTSMLNRFQQNQRKFKLKIDIMKQIKDEEEMINVQAVPEVSRKFVKVPHEDFLVRQEIYKNQVERKIQEMQEIQQNKKMEHIKADPSYGVNIEIDELQKKIDWMVKWKQLVKKKHREIQKEVNRQFFDECTFTPDIKRRSHRTSESLEGKSKIMSIGDSKYDRSISAPRTRKNSKNSDISGNTLKKNNTKESCNNKGRSGVSTFSPKHLVSYSKGKRNLDLSPSKSSSKRNLNLSPSKSSSKKFVLIPDTSSVDKNEFRNEETFNEINEKPVVNNLARLNLLKNNNNFYKNEIPAGAGEFSMKNKNLKIFPKLTEKEIQIMEDLLMQKINGGDD